MELAGALLGLTPVVLFEDEASFGRISQPEYCWVFGKGRPVVPAVRVRQYRYFFGAVEPRTGEFFYDVYERCSTESYNDYLAKLSRHYKDCLVPLVGDGASWHTSKSLVVPENIRFYKLPAYTPEMNPAEQCWREIRTSGFKNRIFATIADVVSNFADTVRSISRNVFRSITLRTWLPSPVRL
jgi:putative transposase